MCVPSGPPRSSASAPCASSCPVENQRAPTHLPRNRAPGIVSPPDATLQQISQQCWTISNPSCANARLWLWPYKHFRLPAQKRHPPVPLLLPRVGEIEKLQRSVMQ